VPAVPTVEQAARWIAGAELRRAQGIALDLVVVADEPAPGEVLGDGEGEGPRPAPGEVLGEVGLVTMAGGPDRAEIGWWVGPAHRRRGVATRAVGLGAGWAAATLGLELFAEVDPDNAPSIWVAEAAGLRLRLRSKDPE
jgi:RimJ/RimL family protein N-acetyltransferase